MMNVLTFSVNNYQPEVISSSQLDSNAVSSYPFYLTWVGCEGNETNLLQCHNFGVGAIGTGPENKVAVRCSQNGKFLLKNKEQQNIFCQISISGAATSTNKITRSLGKSLSYYQWIASESQLRNELFLAITNRNITNARSLLQVGVNPNSLIDKCCFYNQKSPALVCAVCVQQFEIVELLVAYGAQVDLRESVYNITALMESARGGNLRIARKLVESGAGVNLITKYKNTPLMFAAMNGHLDVVKYLVEEGANLNAVDISGNTAKQWALDRNRQEIANFFASAK